MNRQVLESSKSAASAINILGGVIGMLEAGTTTGWDTTARRIILMCQREQHRQLKIMDAADAKLRLPYAFTQREWKHHG